MIRLHVNCVPFMRNRNRGNGGGRCGRAYLMRGRLLCCGEAHCSILRRLESHLLS